MRVIETSGPKLKHRQSIETLVLGPSKFHKKNNTQDGDKNCEGMHFRQLDSIHSTFRMLHHTFSNACVIFSKTIWVQ